MSNFALQFIPGGSESPEAKESDRSQARRTRRPVAATAGGVARGGSLGFFDEIMGFGGGVISALQGDGFRSGYESVRDQTRGMAERDRAEHPVLSGAGEIAGALAIPAPGLAQGGSILAQAGRGAATGAVMGGAYGFGNAEGGVNERVRGARDGAVVGGLVGGAAGAAIPYATRSAQARATRRALNAADGASLADDAGNQARALYQGLDQRGVVFRPDSFGGFAQNLTAKMADEGIDDVLTPTAARGLRRLAAAADDGPVSLTKLETLRRIVRSVPKDASDADLRLVEKITQEIDDYVFRLVDSDVMSNVPGAADGIGKDLARARELWSRVKRSERISAAIDAAADAASGFENGLRVEFRKLLRNRAIRRSLSKDELAAIREVTQGTPLGNLLKRVSKIGFGLNQQTNVLGGGLASGFGAYVGSTVGGPAGAVAGALAPGMVGKAASVGAERATLNAARRAQAVAALGGVAPSAAIPATSGVNALRLLPQGSVPVQNELLNIGR